MNIVFLYILALIALLIFLGIYFYDRRRLSIGFSFNVFLFFLLVSIILASEKSNNVVLQSTLLGLIAIIAVLLIFGVYILIIGLFINAKIVMKKERRSLSNMLTLILAIGLICYIILDNIFVNNGISVFDFVYFIALYILIDVISFLVSMLIYQFNRPKFNQDFIIVLGSRLMGDKVPPLLASRIDKAIEFYEKQAKVTTPPKIIFSGGQGSDEDIAEGLGMQRYAISKGVPVSDTIVEDKSTTTLENMKFSKAIMDKLKPNSYNSVFVTNNYHLFRAGIYARISGLKSNGIGSKTAKYFVPNALIREYIAIASMYKKRHIIVFSLIILFNLIILILPKIMLFIMNVVK